MQALVGVNVHDVEIRDPIIAKYVFQAKFVTPVCWNAEPRLDCTDISIASKHVGLHLGRDRFGLCGGHRTMRGQRGDRFAGQHVDGLGDQALDERRALAGESGVEIADNYRGERAISAYGLLGFQGLQWAVITEKDVQEVLRPAKHLRRNLLLAGLASLAIVALAALVNPPPLTRNV